MIHRNTIASDIPIGSEASFFTQFGREHRGEVLEYGPTHLRLRKTTGEETSILLASIAEWTRHAGPACANATTAPPLPPKRDTALSPEAAADPSKREAMHAVNRAPQPVTLPVSAPVPSAASTLTVTPSPPAATDLTWLPKRLELEARIGGACLTPSEPPFIFPEKDLPGSAMLDPRKLWNRARDVYLYAKRINELGSHFGRIRPRVEDFRKLARHFPESHVVAHHLAFFEHLAGDTQAAVKSLVSHLEHRPASPAWKQLAIYAAASGSPALALAALLESPSLSQGGADPSDHVLWWYAAQQVIAHRAVAFWSSWIEQHLALQRQIAI